MMYNAQLETFVRVADVGSFAKAAQALYISPTAVIKQINLLESSLNLKLFVRTNRGIVLTDAGRSLYWDAKYVIQYARNALNRAHDVEKYRHRIRIGTSVMVMEQILNTLLPKVQTACPELQFQIIPFESSHAVSRSILENIGKDIDVVLAMCDLNRPLRYAILPLSYEPICCGVSILHPLARKECLQVEDLYGQNFMLWERGFNSHADSLRDFLEQKHPQIHIEDLAFIDIDQFNQCENNRDVIYAFEKWQGKHPLLKIIPVDWPFTMPYGLLYSREPSDAVRVFIDTAKHVYRALVPGKRSGR